MKRMSDVFELPVTITEIVIDGEELNYGTCEQDRHAAHAINHIDALADALENAMFYLEWSCSISISAIVVYNDCAKALTAYRGNK